jgi:hypothetical protein
MAHNRDEAQATKKEFFHDVGLSWIFKSS